MLKECNCEYWEIQYIDDITEDNTIEQIKNTKVGAFIYNSEIEKMRDYAK